MPNPNTASKDSVVYNTDIFVAGQQNDSLAFISIHLKRAPQMSFPTVSSTFYGAIQFCLLINEALTYDLLAIVTNQVIYGITGRNFLFSDECLSNEIQDHIEMYIHALDDIHYFDPLHPEYETLRALKDTIFLKKAESIDIGEPDVYNFVQAKTFNYNQGVRKCYYGTPADPYMKGKKRSKSATVPNGQTAWKERLIEYGK